MESTKKVIDLSMDDILPNRFQPRIKFNEEAINELSESIKEHGVIQPIVVRPVGDKYEIIAGERRYKASTLAGKTSIPAIVTDLNDKDSAEVALIENVQRQNLTPIEEAISYKKILDMGYLNQTSLAEKLGKNQSTVANKLRLLELTDDAQEALLDSKISERHARSLLRISDATKQISMLGRIINERMTVRKTDEEINKMLNSEETNTSAILEEPVQTVNTQVNNGFESPLTFESLFSNKPVNQVEETTTNPFGASETEPVEEIVFEPTVNPGFMDVDKVMSEAKPLETAPTEQKPIDELIPNMPSNDAFKEEIISPDPSFQQPKFFNILGENNSTQEVPTESKEPVQESTFKFDSLFNNNQSVDVPFKSETTPETNTEIPEVVEPVIPVPQPIEPSEFFNSTPRTEEQEIVSTETVKNTTHLDQPIETPVENPVAVGFDEVKGVVDSFTQQLEALGFKSEADQFDLGDMYQVIFRIERK